MNLAYILSAYKHPRQVCRLIDRLNAPANAFFVHVDKKADDRVYSEIKRNVGRYPNVCLLKRRRCEWGGFGHVAATLEGIREIVRRRVDFDYAILLTGQDYPIKPIRDIELFLALNKGTPFLEFFPLPTPEWCNRGKTGGMDRIEEWHWRVLGREIRLPLKRSFPRGYKPFGGSSYWCLPRECIEYVYAVACRDRSFVRFFHFVDVPDELFFQTILLNSPFGLSIVNDNLRYIDWKDPNAGSPGILGSGDFEKLALSSKLFARKFDETVDRHVLDLIDRELLHVT
jgi:hypothetical protein